MTQQSIRDLLEHVLGSVMRASVEAEAIKLMAKQYGIGHQGMELLAMAMRIRRYAVDCIERTGEVDPTLWLIDADGRQWAMDAELSNSDCDEDDDGYPNALRLLLKKLDATSYLIVRETQSVRINMNMTLLEKRAMRDNPDKVEQVVCMFGEAVDGSALIISYLRDQPGRQIDIENPLTSVVGLKWHWPGPHGAQFTDHGMKELLPRPEGK